MLLVFFVLNFLNYFHIKINNLLMSNLEQQNGHPHTNETRNQFNKIVSRYRVLGKSKKVHWDGKRRNRSI
jgi:type VI protein secretion system component Hcp